MARFQIDSGKLAESFLLGIAQILLWGGSFFLLSILGKPMMQSTGWSHGFIYGCLSFSILISGLISPRVGSIINKSDKNYLLLFSGLVMGLGLMLLSVSYHKLPFIFAWIVIGIGMGLGLYDALFGSLGKKYGSLASKSIVQITLVSGFTTSVIWPLLAFMNEQWEWRSSVQIYGLLLILIVSPIHYFSFFRKVKPKEKGVQLSKEANIILKPKPAIIPSLKSAFYLLVVNFTFGSFLMTGIYIYLIDILKDKGLTLTQAIAIGALLGPSQVGIRVLDLILPKKSPIQTAAISSITILLAMLSLLLSPKIAFLGVILFGLGNGMRSILRGTLPLWIFQQRIYAKMLGKLALLPLVAQAATPLVGGFIIDHFSANTFLNVLCILAAINIIPILQLRAVMKGKKLSASLSFRSKSESRY